MVSVGSSLRRTALLSAGIALAGAFWFQRERSTRPVLPPAVEAIPRWVDTTQGRVAWYERGEGPPVVLIHSLNAAGSAYEIRPLFERLASHGRTAMTFDWLGFGLSDRPDMDYRPDQYRGLLRELLEQVGQGPIDVVALSLPGQYVARLAVETPERFRRLAFISPTGFGRFTRPAPAAITLFDATVRRAGPGELLFRLLATRLSIRWFLQRIFADPGRVPAGLVEYGWRTTHQEGARFAPLAFVSGGLNDPDAEQHYRSLIVPALLLFGDHPQFADPNAARRLAEGNRALTVEIVSQSGDLPQFERPDATYERISRFLA